MLLVKKQEKIPTTVNAAHVYLKNNVTNGSVFDNSNIISVVKGELDICRVIEFRNSKFPNAISVQYLDSNMKRRLSIIWKDGKLATRIK